MCTRQIERIAAENPRLVRDVWIEDFNTSERVGELFDWMELYGSGAEKLAPLVQSKSFSIRHSHVARSDVSSLDATAGDVRIIREKTAEMAEMAARFGHQAAETASA